MYGWMVILLGVCAGSLPHFSVRYHLGILTGFQLVVMEWMMDCLMDQQTNLMMYRWQGIFAGDELLGIRVQQYS